MQGNATPTASRDALNTVIHAGKLIRSTTFSYESKCSDLKKKEKKTMVAMTVELLGKGDRTWLPPCVVQEF